MTACRGCGASFDPRRPNNAYCSKSCKGRTKMRRRRGTLEPRACATCGTAFVSVTRQRFCSVKCRPHGGGGGGINKRGRRLTAETGAAYEVIRPAVVFVRDDWTCGICGDPIAGSHADPRCPNPWGPSVDHVVPLALGGDHTYANVRASHFICNTRRGAESPCPDVARHLVLT